MTTFDVSKNDPGTAITVTGARSVGASTISISGWPAGWTSFPMILTAVRSGSLRAYFRVTGQASGVLSGVTPVEGSDASLAIGDLLFNRPTAGNDLALKDSINNLESTRVVALGVAGGQTIYGGTGAGDTLTLGSTTHAIKGNIEFIGDFVPQVSNTYDIGHSGGQRFRNIYANGIIETNVGHFAGDGSGLTNIPQSGVSGLTTSLSGKLAAASNLSDVASTSTARTNLGLAIGTNVQAYDADLDAIAGLTSAVDKVPYFTGSGTAAVATLTTFGRSLIDDVDASTARTTLGLVIGTDVQAYDADLDAIAALTKTKGNVIAASGSVWATLAVGTDGQVLTADAASSNGVKWSTVSGTVTSVDLVVPTGLSVSGSPITTTGTLTISTTLSGILKGTGSGFAVATAGTDYLAPAAIGTTIQAYDVELAAIAGLTSAADKVPYFTGSGTASLATLTTFGRSLIDDADASTARTTLGLGTIATAAIGDYLASGTIGTTVQAYDADLDAIAGLTSAADKVPYFTGSGTAALATLTTFGRSLVDDTDASTARTTLGLVIGTDVQAYDAELVALAGLTSAADRLPYFTGSGTASLATFTTFGRSLVDDVDATTARTTLGLGTIATHLESDYLQPSTKVTVLGRDGPVTTAADGATITLDLSTSDLFKTTPGGNRTLALSNPTVGQVFRLILIGDGTARDLTWWSGIIWFTTDGLKPTPASGSGKRTVLTFLCESSGVYLGFLVGTQI